MSASRTIPQQEGIRETIESIVVALILAFVFRAFVVEAFIIPTGSMAPTLYGAHATILCENCGTEFAYGLRDPSEKRTEGPVVRPESPAICPNCDQVHRELKVTDVTDRPEPGDRILVLKWPIDLPGSWLGPQRWDVTVFKDPKDGDTNFIKRLVGLPNEVLMLTDGDVFTAPASSLSEHTRNELLELARAKHKLMGPPPNVGPRDPQPIRRLWALGQKPRTLSAVAMDEITDKMRVSRKTETAQKALWFVLFDNDFPPEDPANTQPHWTAPGGEQSGWTIGERRLRFADRGTPDDNIVLMGKALKAQCAYNVFIGEEPEVVSDLRVRFVVTPASPGGQISTRLMKWGRAFRATVQMDGEVRIDEEASQRSNGALLSLVGRTRPLGVGVPTEVSFEHLDYRLALSVRGEEVLASSDDPESKAYYAPNLKSLLHRRPPASMAPQIYGEGGSFELTHLVVERDVHYFHRPEGRDGYLPPGGWGSEGNPILLREDEYFMLGDNTAASSDSRLWNLVDLQFAQRGEKFQLGTVPRDQIIGRAFFVYWPAGRRIDWLPFLRLGIIPDVGRMRWIR